MPDNAQIVIELDKKRMAAMVAQDFAAVEAILADDLVYVHSSAALDDKTSIVANMRSGKTVYMGADPSDVTAKDFGDIVVLNGVARMQVVSGGTAMPAFRIRFIDVYARRDGRWQMVAWQSTRMPE